ncbi:dihydroxyacetone kinase subunit L [Vibrio sp. JC009]|uniref:dihydroxyacetone kinase subunit DhaL n=1 Tax=Vibrio sp. JC009 TaxID=2912314 RepID=UPI0023AF3BAF|nr:dihydroxyacetone kinase subunit DhaL [Vibrio sp. JC009]WED23595.1 dihydroxyacetone kinase subunit L [Vibrio sp. JC009]
MTVFNQDLLFGMFETAAKNIEAQAQLLNELDGKTGDGDHGTTMLRVCHCIEDALHKEPEAWSKQVDELGWAIMSQDGGSAGMLVGNLFMGIGSGLTEEELPPEKAAAAIKSGVDRVVQFSGAHQGDKTMLDALIPAAEALEKEAVSGADLETMFESAARAAREGAEATKEMVPTRGRAKNMGEKAVGYIDPGATSMAILFESFNQAIHEKH